MAKSPKTAKNSATLVIDLHGMKEALSTNRNSLRSAVIEAIQSGKMLILKQVSTEMKDVYPELYDNFQSIKPKKYLPVSVAASSAAAIMMDTSGANPLGAIPPLDRFEALAAARRESCALVTFGKALADCTAIAAQNRMPRGCVISVASLA